MIKYRYTYEDGSFIEHLNANDFNEDIRNYLQEIEILETETFIEKPSQTTLAKFRMAFRRVTGTRIETIIEQIKLLPDSDSKFDMIDLLEYSNVIERNNQTLIEGALSFNITLEQLDEIFITAENLNY